MDEKVFADSDLKTFTKDEVTNRKGDAKYKDELWIIIGGYVYDLSSIMLTHPGGPHILRNNPEKDVTKLFNQIHRESVLEKKKNSEVKSRKNCM